MTFIEGLRAFLAASSGVVTLTGAKSLFPAEGAQNTGAPRLVYERESEVDDIALDRGACGQPTVKGKIRCYGGKWGTGYTTARQLADAVKAANGGVSGGRTLDSWAGATPTFSLGSVFCQAFWFTEDLDHDEPAKDASGRGEQSVELSFTAVYAKQ